MFDKPFIHTSGLECGPSKESQHQDRTASNQNFVKAAASCKRDLWHNDDSLLIDEEDKDKMVELAILTINASVAASLIVTSRPAVIWALETTH